MPKQPPLCPDWEHAALLIAIREQANQVVFEYVGVCYKSHQASCKIAKQIMARFARQFYTSRQYSTELHGWLAHPLNPTQPSSDLTRILEQRAVKDQSQFCTPRLESGLQRKGISKWRKGREDRGTASATLHVPGRQCPCGAMPETPPRCQTPMRDG